MITASTSNSMHAKSCIPFNQAASSSSVSAGFVLRRQIAFQAEPSQMPNTVWVFPESIAKSMGQIHPSVDLSSGFSFQSIDDILDELIAKLVAIRLQHNADHRLRPASPDVDPYAAL